MIAELESVRVTRDLPNQGARAGSTGVVVHVYRDGVAYEVELMDPNGDTLGVATVPAEALEAAG